ncbi:MAG: dTMP kinase, partial [Verrucomicrobia bacterium]|nr:dTMP kinase [Verrucomicrobiota bacterium]
DRVIVPALGRGAVVLCDRFADSTIAYQGFGKELGADYVEKCCRQVSGGVEPDLTFFVDLDPEIGLERVDKRAAGVGPDRMEQEALAFHKRVHQGFIELAKKFPERIVRLDGTLSKDALYEAAFDKVERLMGQQ